MTSNKKVSQQDLRQMMKERKQIQSKQVTETVAKIESPLARYDPQQGLICIICEVQIISNSLWSSHIISKSHKNKLEEIKRKKLTQSLNSQKPKTNTIDNSINQLENVETNQTNVKSILKRKLESNINDSKIDHKIAKSVDIEENEKIFNENNAINESEIDEDNKVLPNDFFDNPNDIQSDNNQDFEFKRPEEPETDVSSNSLPKGFFDDPMKDAKARHVPFKDPIDEEWNRFQKVIAEETNTSQNIIEGDIEEIQVERNITEIEEQISIWAKVNEFQKKAEELHANTNKNSCMEIDANDSDSDIDEQELDVFSNWRSRRALNSK